MASVDPYTLFTEILEKSGLPYCITGSVASGIYGESRQTNDIDFVLLLQRQDIARLLSLFSEAEYYVPPVEVLILETRRDQRGMFNLIHQATQFKADVFVAASDPLHRWALQHRRRITLSDNVQTWVAPPEYVILRKLEYFRESDNTKHLRDIRFMLEATPEVDQGFLDSQIERLGLQAQWHIVLNPGPPLYPAT